MDDVLVMLLGEAVLMVFDIVGAYIFIWLYFGFYQNVKLSRKDQLFVVMFWVVGHLILRLLF